MSAVFFTSYVVVNLCGADGICLGYLKPSHKIKHLRCYLAGWSDFMSYVANLKHNTHTSSLLN